VSRDLLWFIGRYPMVLSRSDRLRLGKLARQFDERIQGFALLLGGEIEPRQFDLAIPLRQYQAVASEMWLRAGGLLVADELGLGKTAVAIAGMADPKLRPALVVVPTHLQYQWAAEIERFLPGVNVHVLKKSTPYDMTEPPRRRRRKADNQNELFNERLPFPDVIIGTYYKLSGWADTLAPIINSVVYDEVQDLRHPEAAKTQAARFLSASVDYRIGLSATPIYNYGDEFFEVMEALRPGALGARGEFENEWCRSWGRKHLIQDTKAFGSFVRESGLMLQRTRTEVGRELPALSRVPHLVDTDTKALDAVEDSVAELCRVILAQGGNPLEKGRAGREIDWKLRQATGIAKAPHVAAFVRMLIEGGEKVVLFGWHREVYSIWLSKLKEFKPLLYTGSESPKQKNDAIELFIKSDQKMRPLLIMSLRSGSGVDGLQKVCRTVVYGELDWSPAMHDQGIGRAFRDGQMDPVMAYFLYSNAGSDPVVMDVLQLKKTQADGIMDPDGDLVKRLTIDPLHIQKLAKHYLASKERKV
jgi:SNF2 family DNA or RNA helicase